MGHESPRIDQAADSPDPTDEVAVLRQRLAEAEASRAELARELSRLRGRVPMLEALGDIVEAIVIYDASGRLVVCNENFRQLYGYTVEEARPGVHFSELGRIDVERGNVAVGDEFGDGEAYLARKAEYRRTLTGSFIVKLKDGRWIKTIDRPVRGGGFASIQVDITEVKALEQKMRFMAGHDDLTGLPNRRLFMEQGNLLLSRARRDRAALAMLFLDIDDFKHVNDTHGHRSGDLLLAQLAARLRQRLRGEDLLARLGGDEFLALVGMNRPDTATRIAEELIGETREPFMVEDRTLRVGVSVGIAYYPSDSDDFERLISLSDIALYRAKKAGRGRWCEFPAAS